jgi:hypothetical protein
LADLATDVATAVYGQLGGQWTADEDADPAESQLYFHLQATRWRITVTRNVTGESQRPPPAGGGRPDDRVATVSNHAAAAAMCLFAVCTRTENSLLAT